MKTLIGVISDTHISGNIDNIPKKVISELKKMDLVVHAGDIISLQTFEELKKILPNFKAVQGNMDDEEIKKILPEKELFTIDKIKIALTHGRGSPSLLLQTVHEDFNDDHPDIIIYGHSHSPTNETKNGILFFNPGSLMDTIYAAYNSYGIIEIEENKINSRIIKI